MAGKYQLTTFGCKVSQYESQQLRETLESIGLRAAGPHEVPDLAVVNTCAVTSEAVRKGDQAIRRLSRGGLTSVVVVGCGASADAGRLGNSSHVAAVFGHDVDVPTELRKLIVDRLKLCSPNSSDPVRPSAQPAAARQALRMNEIRMSPFSASQGAEASSPFGGAAFPINDSARYLPIVNTPEVLLGRIESFVGHQRAFLKIQDGCDAFCTYCIIPRLRPHVRSKPIDLVVAEAEGLVRAGHKEIILTGIFLGAYGRDTAIRKRFGTASSPLADVVRAVADIDGLTRLRLSSLEPGDVDDALLEVFVSQSRCVPHLHLPMQSGSPAILRRMNRQYTVDAFLAMIERVRSALDRPAITTDLIVGFPGETDADFEASLEVGRQAEFLKIHAFPFSPRAGTAAARWQKEFVSRSEVRRRMGRLAAVERECSVRYRRRLLGTVERVIVETGPDAADTPWETTRSGRADRYLEVHFEAADVVPGEVARVRIDRLTPTRTHGTHLRPAASSYPLAIFPW